MGYKAAAQVLKSADTIKSKIQKQCDLLNDDTFWTNQQELQTIYHQVLVLDLEYALDKKVEQELWMFGFKTHISSLQEITRDKKNPKRSDAQALLAWCLESASGFYLTLLQELCTTFDLDLPFRRKGLAYGQLKCSNVTEPVTLPQTSSCLYICQYCLVHLGDIARYRNQQKQAETFYKQAIVVSPKSGHPYNQLALLEASNRDKLSAVFHYTRGIAVKNPFPATATNLSNTLSAIIDKDEPLSKIQTKMTVNEFITLFLRTHGLLHSLTNLDDAEALIKRLNSTLTALIATQSFTMGQLIKISVINMYALWHISGLKLMETTELTGDENRARELVLELLVGSLSAFLLPVYTLKSDATIMDYYALPAIKLLLNWIQINPTILEESVFAKRLEIWPGLCKLLNNIQPYIVEDFNKFAKIPLLEDIELQGFLPLSEQFAKFEFKMSTDDITDKENIRCYRILEFGRWLTTLTVKNVKLIIGNQNEGAENLTTFEPGCIQPDPTDQLLEEMKSMSVVEKINSAKEKKGGILKPQGSLEKSREERESYNINSTSVLENTAANAAICTASKAEATKLKRSKQNVALQSIYKKMEENKQVKFSVEIVDNEKEKLKKSPSKTPSHQIPSLFGQGLIPFPVTTEIAQDFFENTRRQVANERSMAANMMFSKNGLDPMPKGPFSLPSVPPQAYNNQNQQQGPGTVFSMPANVSNPFNLPINSNATFQKQQQIMPPAPQNQMSSPGMYGNMQQGGNNWNAEKPAGNPGNWWPNSQMPAPAQQQGNYNYPANYPGPNAGMNNMPSYPTQGVTVDYNTNMYSTPWQGNMQPPQQSNMIPNQNMMSYNSGNAGMSMRQAMLNESKNPPMPNMPIQMNNIPSDTIPMPQAPGYSLFNSSRWAPNLSGQIRSQQNENLMSSMPQHSLFNYNTPSLKQLIEQNKLQKEK